MTGLSWSRLIDCGSSFPLAIIRYSSGNTSRWVCVMISAPVALISSRLLSPAVRCTLGKHLCRKRETHACILANRVQVENRGGVSASPMIFLGDCNQRSFLSTLNFVFAETPSCSNLLAQKMAVQSDFLDTQSPLLLRIWCLAPGLRICQLGCCHTV